MSEAVPYEHLTPDLVLSALESRGYRPDGRLLALASYENRVYQIGTEQGVVVAKFYRPRRWSDDAILEEHGFSLSLARAELPVVPPIVLGGETLHRFEGYRFAVFEARGGRWPELATASERVWLGRFLARMHSLGTVDLFEHRATLSTDRLGRAAVEEVLDGDWVPRHLMVSYESTVSDLLSAIERVFADVGPYRTLRIHGDCHRGNVLWTEDGPHFVDLDDCMNGPAVQDLWLFMAGNREEMTMQLADLLEGYQQFLDFDYRELRLIEALRALRMIHYTAWLARRWSDPAFPRAFPWFAENKYWEDHVLALREQRAALEEPALAVG
jgi:Ser/Thr protein kinase RdoA (MazF antagonist)